MSHEIVVRPDAANPFDAIRRIRPDGSEFWSARDLRQALGYIEWRKFEDAIERARVACKNSGQTPENHFVPVAKMVKVGSGSIREVADWHLSRYGAYLVAMNGDPRKPEIAAAQMYFAVKTRQAEILEKEPPKPVLPEDYLSALKALVVSEEQKQRLAIENAAQSAKILEDAPKVAGYTDVIDSSGLLSVQQVAAMLHHKPNKLFEALRRDGYLMDKRNVGKDRHNMPYAKHIEAGLFEVKTKAWENGDNGGIGTRVWVTGKGLDILRRRYLHSEAA